MLWLDQDLKTFYEISIFRTTQKITKETKVTKSDPISTILRVCVILLQINILKVLTSIWWNSNIDQAWNNMSKTIQANGVSRFGVVELMKQDTSINFAFTWVKNKVQKKIRDQVLFWKWLNPFKIVTVCVPLIVKLCWKGMLEMPVDREVKRGDFVYLYSDKVSSCDKVSKVRLAVSSWTGIQ